MMYITACASCVHRREVKKDGWIPTCDAYPDGVPLNSEFPKRRGTEICNPENGIGYEPIEAHKND